MIDQMTVAGIVFDIPALYVPGYMLSESEAEAFEQVRKDRLRNNLKPKVEKRLAAGEAAEEIQDDLRGYIENYRLGTRNGMGPVRDPVMVEALHMAKQDLIKELMKKGKKVKDVNGIRLMKASRKAVALAPEYLKRAQRRLEETSVLASTDLKSVVAELG